MAEHGKSETFFEDGFELLIRPMGEGVSIEWFVKFIDEEEGAWLEGKGKNELGMERERQIMSYFFVDTTRFKVGENKM